MNKLEPKATDSLEYKLNSLVPPMCKYVYISDLPTYYGLMLEEELLTTKMSNKRLMDFTKGRYCAREALKYLKIENHPVLINEHRAPIWPETIVGSISHSDSHCIAVTGLNNRIESIGVDIENLEPLDQELLSLICNAREKTALQLFNDYLVAAKIVFSIKESIFKCLHPICLQWIDFKDVEVHLDRSSNTYKVELNNKVQQLVKKNSLSGLWIEHDNYVYSCCNILP